MIKNLIFDVDGTLWDSVAAVAAAWNEVLSRYPGVRKDAVTKEEVYSYMGHTMDEIANRMIPLASKEMRSEIMQACMDYENTYLLSHSGTFYPDVKGTLIKLKDMGYAMYVVSNCQEGYIETMLHCGDIPYADPFYNTQSFSDADPLILDLECFGRTQKGKDQNIRLLMERNHLKSEESVYVGDTEMDAKASELAGIGMIHAAYGFGYVEQAVARVSAFSELPEVLKGL